MIKIKEYFSERGAWLKLLIRIGLFMVLLAPVIVYQGAYFPFIVPRNMFFRLVIDIIFPLYIYGVISKIFDWPKFNKAFIFFILFILTLTISSIFGGHFLFSFWSNFERMDGLVNWYHLLMYVIVLLGVNNRQKDWNFLLKGTLLVAWFISLYAIGQAMKISFLIPSSGGQRLASLLGNAAYVGSYLFLHIVIATYFLFGKIKEKRFWTVANFYYLLSIILFTAVLLATETRGAFVGLIVFSFSLAIFYLIHERHRRRVFYYLVLGALILGFIFILLIFIQKDSTWVKSIPIFSRIANISLNDTTTQSRLMIWRNSLYAWQEKPILGWGEENFSDAFNKYFPAEIFINEGSEVWYDRPHNILIQHLVQGGMLGLGFYLAIFVYLLYAFWKYLRKDEYWFIAAILAAFLLCFLAQDFFIFDNVSVNVVFYLILAHLLAFNPKDNHSQSRFAQLFDNWRDNVVKSRLKLGLRTFMLFLLGVSMIYFMVWKPWRSNIIFLQTFLEAPLADSNDEFEKVKNDWLEAYYLAPLGDKEKTAALNDLLGLVIGNSNADNDFRFEFINLTGQYLELTHQKYPLDIRQGMFLSNFYQFIRTFDKTFIDQDIALLEEMAKNAPNRLEIKFALLADYIKKGELHKAKEQALLARDLAPKTRIVYWHLAKVHWLNKEYEDFDVAIKKLRDDSRRRGNSDDFSLVEMSYLQNYLNEARDAKNTELINLISAYFY